MSMVNPPAPPRGPECPPAVVLEALSAGEPPDELVARHVTGCASCRGYVESLGTARDAYLRARPPEQFLKKLERREAQKAKARPWWRWLLAAAPLAAAAVVALVVIPGDGVREKGGGGFRVAALPAGSSEPRLLAPDSRVQAGDSLRFGWEGERDGHLLVLERDGTGSASVFWPFGADASAPVEKGRRAFLEGSVELDDAPGPEWIVAVFSPRPIAAGPLLERLRADPSAAPAVACPDCSVQTIRLLKAP